jgi:hypothetical protein
LKVARAVRIVRRLYNVHAVSYFAFGVIDTVCIFCFFCILKPFLLWISICEVVRKCNFACSVNDTACTVHTVSMNSLHRACGVIYTALGLKRKFSFSHFRENLFSFSRKILTKIDENSGKFHKNFHENAKSVISTTYFNFLRKVLSIIFILF